MFGWKKKKNTYTHKRRLIWRYELYANIEGPAFVQTDQYLLCPYTLQPHYNMIHYNTILDITQFKDGSQKCIDYIEKWP